MPHARKHLLDTDARKQSAAVNIAPVKSFHPQRPIPPYFGALRCAGHAVLLGCGGVSGPLLTKSAAAARKDGQALERAPRCLMPKVRSVLFRSAVGVESHSQQIPFLGCVIPGGAA